MFWLMVSKELKELRRDRKTFWFVVLFPTVILPLLLVFGVWLASSSITKKQSESLSFAIVAEPQWQQQLAELLEQDPQLQWRQSLFTEEQAIRTLINQGELDFILQLPPNFSPGQQSQQWFLHYNQAMDLGQFQRVEVQLEPLFVQYQQQFQQQLQLTDEQLTLLLEPVKLVHQGTAAMRENVGEKMGGMLPYMLIFLCLMGAMIPALDLAAGEKERGTLETLLLAPMQRYSIVLAKYFVVVLCSIGVALLTVISGLVWLLGLGRALAMEQLAKAVSAVGLLDLGLVLLALLPIAMILGALMLTASFFARTYKEGQSYLAPVQFVAILPAVIAILPGTELKGGYLWTPIVNVMIASKELIKGTLDYALLLPVFASNLIVALLLLLVSVYLISQERVLFR